MCLADAKSLVHITRNKSTLNVYEIVRKMRVNKLALKLHHTLQTGPRQTEMKSQGQILDYKLWQYIFVVLARCRSERNPKMQQTAKRPFIPVEILWWHHVDSGWRIYPERIPDEQH